LTPLGGGAFEGLKQPACFNLSPVTWDYLRTRQFLNKTRWSIPCHFMLKHSAKTSQLL
jgi:hypothetical protein